MKVLQNTKTENQQTEHSSWRDHLFHASLDLMAGIIICSGTIAALWAFWQPGVTSEADMLIGIYRLFELDQSWAERIFFPRVAMGLNFGYSGPLFQYYPPLASYIALVFRWIGFGWISAVKAGFSMALALAGIGAYTYARWFFADRRAALVTAFAYLLAPYLLLNIYERGANAELLALGLLPWIFSAVHHMLRSEDQAWLWTSAVLLALLMLAHNITTLFVLPVLTVYVVVLAWHEGALHRLPMVALAFALGLALSAFYWLPAFAERGFSQLEGQMLGGSNQPEIHLRAIENLFQASLAFDYWGKWRFHPALWQAIAAIIGLLAVMVAPRRLCVALIFFAAMLVVLYLLQLSISAVFWQTVPLVRFIQFPWRLLGPVAFFTALLLGAVFCWPRLAGALGWGGAILCVVIIGYAGLRNLDPKLSTIWYPITDAEIGRKDLFARGAQGYPLYSDYAPASMQAAPWDITRPRAPGTPVPSPLAVRPAVRIESEGGDCLTLKVQTPAPFILRLPRIDFPIWRVSVSGQPAPVTISQPLGLLTVTIPTGEHSVQACFGDTPLRIAATLVSLLALLALVVGGLRSPSFRKVIFASMVFCGVAAMLALLHHGVGQPSRRPTAIAAQLEDEITLIGYHLSRTTLRPGDVLDLRLYWLVNRTPIADYKVFIHVRKLDDSSTVLQVDEPPLHGQDFTTRWNPGEIIVDEHQIPIEDTVPAGAYRLLVGMYRPDTVRNLRVTGTADVLPGDRVALSQITIREK